MGGRSLICSADLRSPTSQILHQSCRIPVVDVAVAVDVAGCMALLNGDICGGHAVGEMDLNLMLT